MKNQLIISLLAICLMGCGPDLYLPTTINAPLLEKKGDFKASFAMAQDENFANFQGAYAIKNNWAILTNAATLDNDNSGTSHHLLEAGGGYFTAFGKNKCGVNVGRAELMGGFGGASVNSSFERFVLFGDNVRHNYDGKYRRAYLQPAIGYRGRIFEASFATRLAFVHFGDYHHYVDGKLADRNGLGASFTTIEPTVTLSLGFKRGKVFLQMGQLHATGGSSSDYSKVSSPVFKYIPTHSFGFTFSTWKEKCPLNPAIALAEPAPKAEAPQAPAAKLDTTAVAQTETVQPTTIIPLNQPNASICVRDAGSPDGDVVSITFNGSYLAQDLELVKRQHCFDIFAKKGEENLLRIHAISDGKLVPNTIQVTVKEGKSERKFYIRTDKGKVEEVRFVL
jgi:hypothetical protein